MSMNPFAIGDRVTLKDRTYYDGTVVRTFADGSVTVYWRTSWRTDGGTGSHSADTLARKT